jgi:hypothetical protein
MIQDLEMIAFEQVIGIVMSEKCSAVRQTAIQCLLHADLRGDLP